MKENIFYLFKQAANRYGIRYINCVESPERAAFGFLRTQILTRKKPPKNTYEHYVVCLDTTDAAIRFMDAFPEIVKRAGLLLYKCVYYRSGNEVNVIFNSVDMTGKGFGLLQETAFRLASQ